MKHTDDTDDGFSVKSLCFTSITLIFYRFYHIIILLLITSISKFVNRSLKCSSPSSSNYKEKKLFLAKVLESFVYKKHLDMERKLVILHTQYYPSRPTIVAFIRRNKDDYITSCGTVGPTFGGIPQP